MGTNFSAANPFCYNFAYFHHFTHFWTRVSRSSTILHILPILLILPIFTILKMGTHFSSLFHQFSPFCHLRQKMFFAPLIKCFYRAYEGYTMQEVLKKIFNGNLKDTPYVRGSSIACSQCPPLFEMLHSVFCVVQGAEHHDTLKGEAFEEINSL